MHHDSYFCFQIKEIRNNEIISFGSTDVPEQSTDVPEQSTDIPEQSTDVTKQTAGVPPQTTSVEGTR
jgi:hypothetical protein